MHDTALSHAKLSHTKLSLSYITMALIALTTLYSTSIYAHAANSFSLNLKLTPQAKALLKQKHQAMAAYIIYKVLPPVQPSALQHSARPWVQTDKDGYIKLNQKLQWVKLEIDRPTNIAIPANAITNAPLFVEPIVFSYSIKHPLLPDNKLRCVVRGGDATHKLAMATRPGLAATGGAVPVVVACSL